MTSWTKPRTWVAGQTVTAAALNTDLRDDMKNIDERLTFHGITSESALNKVKSAVCGVRLTDAGTQAVDEYEQTTLTWDTETLDSDGFHDAGQPARITIPAGMGGYYIVSVAIRWQSNAGGSRSLWVEDDTGAALGREMVAPSGGTFTNQTLTFAAPLVAGDWIIARAYQGGSSATLDVTKSGTANFFAAYRIFAS